MKYYGKSFSVDKPLGMIVDLMIPRWNCICCQPKKLEVGNKVRDHLHFLLQKELGERD